MFNTLLEEETRRNGKEGLRCAEAVEGKKFLWKEAEKRGKTGNLIPQRTRRTSRGSEQYTDPSLSKKRLAQDDSVMN
jgi:hypothetical protein